MHSLQLLSSYRFSESVGRNYRCFFVKKEFLPTCSQQAKIIVLPQTEELLSLWQQVTSQICQSQTPWRPFAHSVDPGLGFVLLGNVGNVSRVGSSGPLSRRLNTEQTRLYLDKFLSADLLWCTFREILLKMILFKRIGKTFLRATKKIL